MAKTAHSSSKKTVPAETPALFQYERFLSGYAPLVVLAVIAFLLYLPSLKYGFSPMDEQWLILKRQDVLSSFSHLPGLFSSTMMDMYYRPVCDASFLIDNVLGGGTPFMFHLTNVLLHVLCTLLVFRFFKLLRLSAQLSFFSALVFAVHPLTVHAVAWIPGRNDSLLCLFALLSFIQLVKYGQTRKLIWLVLHLVSFVLALFTKESAIVFPALYFLLWRMEVVPEKRRSLFLIIGTWALLAIAWFFLRRNFVSYLPSMSNESFGELLLRFFTALAYYGGKTILPVGQSVMPVLKNITLLPYLLALAVVTAAALRFGFRNKKLALFGLAWFWLPILIPAWASAAGITGEQYEHRIYTSLAGAVLFISQLKLPLKETVVRIAGIILILAFAAKTFYREPVYKSGFSFTIAGTEESPSFAIFHNMLGNLFSAQNQHEKAIVCFTDAITLNPSRAEFYNNRAFSYAALKDYAHALEDDTKVIELSKNPADMYVNRSMVYFFMNRLGEAKADLAKADSLGATQISKKYVNDLYNRLLMDTIMTCTKKIQENPLDAESYNVRGIIWLKVGQPVKAYADFSEALKIEPNDPAISSNRDFARSEMEKTRTDSLQRRPPPKK